ncbi:MAG: hypothetical protein UU47_C0025G0008 [candidate division TM6 bacterium GW2011_GWE2_41_16]|nr:MAG: hypothetical protein UU47_C0025G0008 [candidate division TM6 bacterium GW2011_GWE2_41_16]
MHCVHSMKTGLMFGLFFALIHLVWAILIASQYAKPYMDWMLKLHFIQMPYMVLPFDLRTAAMLVGMTFVCGYIFGVLFSWLWNMGMDCKK